VQHLPAAGEIVLFDRSWYNRAGVEHVMGFCTQEQYEQFMTDVPQFERMLVESAGIIVVKYWLDVSDAAQEARFQGRLHRSWKRWKLSPMDLFARSKWTEYAVARDAMLRRTDHAHAPWKVVPSDNKKAARLNCISDLLSRVDYEEMQPAPLTLPPRDSADDMVARSDGAYANGTYKHPPSSAWRYVPPLYDRAALSTTALCGEDGSPVPCLAEAHEEHDHEDDEDERFAHAGDA